MKKGQQHLLEILRGVAEILTGLARNVSHPSDAILFRFSGPAHVMEAPSMDTKEISPSLAQELDEIVRALDMPRGQLPVDAIHAARRYQDVIVPRLESLIQRAVQQAGRAVHATVR